jgi:hypothetical protein
MPKTTPAVVLTTMIAMVWASVAHCAPGSELQPGENQFSASQFTSAPTRIAKSRTARKGHATRTARKGKAGNLPDFRTTAGRAVDRLNHLARGRPLYDNASTIVFWNGRTRSTGIHRQPDRLALLSAEFPGHTAATAATGFPVHAISTRTAEDVSDASYSPSLAPSHGEIPALLPPGRLSTYNLSFAMPLGKNELFNLQANVRKETSSVQTTSDSRLSAAWARKF